MNRPLLVSALLSATALLSGQAFAERGFFINAAAGEVDVSASERRVFPEDEVTSSDNKDSSFRLGAGYYLNNYFALEAAYHDFGEHSMEAGTDKSAVFETQAISAGLRGRIPVLYRFDIVGKLGISSWEYDASFVDSGVRSSDDDSGTDAYYGLGLSAYLSRHWTLELGAERYDIDDDRIDQGSLGITYTFAK